MQQKVVKLHIPKIFQDYGILRMHPGLLSQRNLAPRVFKDGGASTNHALQMIELGFSTMDQSPKFLKTMIFVPVARSISNHAS